MVAVGLLALAFGLFGMGRESLPMGQWWRSSGWHVLNGHTRRRVSKSFPTRAMAEAKRASLQTKLDVAKALVLRRTPKG